MQTEINKSMSKIRLFVFFRSEGVVTLWELDSHTHTHTETCDRFIDVIWVKRILCQGKFNENGSILPHNRLNAECIVRISCIENRKSTQM